MSKIPTIKRQSSPQLSRPGTDTLGTLDCSIQHGTVERAPLFPLYNTAAIVEFAGDFSSTWTSRVHAPYANGSGNMQRNRCRAARTTKRPEPEPWLPSSDDGNAFHFPFQKSLVAGNGRRWCVACVKAMPINRGTCTEELGRRRCCLMSPGRNSSRQLPSCFFPIFHVGSVL